MRPSIDEQLHGTCRILEEVVAPAVADPYARTILAGLIANLRMLHQAIPAVAAFLQHDNQACAKLLAELADGDDDAAGRAVAMRLGLASADVLAALPPEPENKEAE
jgi:hypothetical protein